MSNPLLDAALTYASQGWPVFPCRNKKPLDRDGHGYQDATTDRDTILAWWRRWPNAQIGIPTGAVSGFIALDIDTPKGGDVGIEQLETSIGSLPDTRRSFTGGGGEHRLFRHPESGIKIKNSARELGPGLDIRGDGGYIIVPPSPHENGHCYTWESTITETSIAPLPPALLALVRQPIPQMDTRQADADGTIADGQRNATLASMAGAMRRQGMQPEEILAGLQAVNGQRCQPPLGDEEVRKISKSMGRYQPEPRASPPVKPQSYPIIRGKEHPQPISCQINAEYWLRHTKKAEHVTLDTFLQRLKMGSEEVSDELIIHLLSQMEDETRVVWNESHIRQALVHIGSQHPHSSLIDWLDGLTWDQTPRLDRFFIEVCGATDDPYSIACAQVMCLSAVARAFKPGCKADVMVVMCGDQGIGKSRSLANLVPDETFFTDDLGGDFHERRVAETLQGKWIVEFGEFARINRATIDMTKAFLSRTTDRYRPAYGRVAKDFPRQCIFVGTTNRPDPLQDVQNRRFMPLWCPRYFIELTSHYRDQLWAEAVYRYRAGEPWWVTDKALMDLTKDRQDEARQGDEWEAMLHDKLLGRMTTTTADAAEMLGIKPDRLDRSAQTRIGLALQVLGWHHKRVRDGATLRWEYHRPGSRCSDLRSELLTSEQR